MPRSLTTEGWGAIERAFLAALEQPQAEREAFVRASHADDPELVAGVLRLLAADAAEAADGADDLLDGTAQQALRGPDPLVGARFGAFRLVERIAEGGMGTVYRAVRADGEFAQDVAVKVLRLGLSTPRMRERFARERQTLARLVHPNVARLLDGGTNEQGVPFIAMERIDGLPIDAWADAHRLTLRERLQLFVTVCRAVQFAHASFVAHLDLKPSNILVDASGAPKLLDFGVAALLEDVAADGGVAAGAGVAATRGRPLTPEYASPEQLRGEPVGTAADVFSLGVVLHELLTGVRPFAGRAGGDLELARAVCETDALRPSASCAATGADETAARERAARRGVAGPTGLARALRGDLDRIVLLALRREPAHRYTSCEAFADDVERFLGGFPVHAREPRLAYRLHRFVARNRLAVAAAAVAVLALLAGMAATLHLARVARAERDAAEAAQRTARAERDVAEAARRKAEADEEHARVEATSSGLVATMLGDTFLSADLVSSPEQRAAARTALLRRAAQVRRQFAAGEQSHLRANLLDALGRSCAAIAAFDDARVLIDEALRLRVEHFGSESLEHALSLASLGRLLYDQGRFDEAAAALGESYRLHTSCPAGVHTDVATAANDLAAAERAAGRRSRARELHEEALRLRRASAGGESTAVAESLNNLANVEDDPHRAAALLRDAVAIRERLLGSDDPLTIQSQVNLARLNIRNGELDAARPLLERAVQASRALGSLGAEALIHALASLGDVALRLSDPAAARAAIDEAVQLERQRFGTEHPRLAAELELRARIHLAQGEIAEAIADRREVMRIRSALVPPGHRDVAAAQVRLGAALAAGGGVAEALPLFEAAMASHLAASPPRIDDLIEARSELATALERAGRDADAERVLLAALAAAEQPPGRTAARDALRRRLAELCRRTGRDAEAVRYESSRGAAEEPIKR